MSDVSKLTPLSSPIETNPYYKLQKETVDLIISHYTQKVKSDAELMREAVYYNDELTAEIYSQIIKLFGPNKLQEFQKAVLRNLTCFNQVIKAITPAKIIKAQHNCGTKGCLGNCAPYKASSRVHYHDIIVRIAETNNYDYALSITKEIKKTFQQQEWTFATVTMTPGHNNRYYVRIGCVLRNKLDLMAPDNDVKEAFRVFDNLFPEFEEVQRISNENAMVSRYITETNRIHFSSTDLYVTREDGRSGLREYGTTKGFFEDSETGLVSFMTDKARKQKEDELAGIIAKQDVPVINANISEDKLRPILERTARRASAHDKKMVFKSESAEDLLYNTTRFMKMLSDELEFSGLPQPAMFMSARISMDDLKSFNGKFSIPHTAIPDNIDTLEITDEMQGRTGKVYGLREKVKVLRAQILKTAQDKIKSAMTIEEYVDMLIKQIYKG